jgi:hypothetical protein
MICVSIVRRFWWAAAVFSLVVAPGCDSPTGTGIPYDGIGDLFPADGADDQDLNLTLHWTGLDDSAKAAPCHYSVFLGTQAPPPLVIDSLTENSFMPGSLQPKTVYFWRVEAYRDTVMIASSPIVHFETDREFTYPLAVGLRWNYWHETYSYTADGQPDPVYRDTGRATVEIVAFDTLFDTREVYDFSIRESIGAEYQSCHFYLNNLHDGLYRFDYTNPSIIAPRPEVERRATMVTCAGRVFDSPARLFAFLRGEITDAVAKRPGPTLEGYSPTKSYGYPVRLGHRWTYRYYSDDGYPFRIDKQVMRRELVSTPAGLFDCFVIQWFWDTNNDGVWENGIDGYDYLAPQGLIKREFYVGKVGTGSYDNPEGVEYYDFYDGYTLTEYGRDRDHGVR